MRLYPVVSGERPGQHPASVILSGVGGREASDNAVEGSLARGTYECHFTEFCQTVESAGGNPIEAEGITAG
jgi:hypothetical protein